MRAPWPMCSEDRRLAGQADRSGRVGASLLSGWSGDPVLAEEASRMWMREMQYLAAEEAVEAALVWESERRTKRWRR